MKLFVDLISEKLGEAFEQAGYDSEYGKAVVSDRPDLCEYQCNEALKAAGRYKCKPYDIAEKVVEHLSADDAFSSVSVAGPGFINLNISKDFLVSYINEMAKSSDSGYEKEKNPHKVIVDYGGANVAKPLHVGHLRSAVIGQAVKNLENFAGNTAVGDVHLGDWGLQMGLIIEELKEESPSLPYFDENFAGEYPKEAPFTLSDLEEIYPRASKKSKEDEEFLKRAQENTLKLQNFDPAYTAIWNHIMDLSVKELNATYDSLGVSFEIWKGESSVQNIIPDMLCDLKERKIAHESKGALVVDIGEPEDKKELPPCIVQKSDGAALYATSDLATIIEREKEYSPDKIIYVADKRQELHFTQVFRTARKAGYVGDNTELIFLGFGTVNGKDGKPFKTRDGGVMRLQTLLCEVKDKVLERMTQRQDLPPGKLDDTAEMIAVAALKYGDLSNQAGRDYIFDIERFTSFEGNTGPYILYTLVRIKSILRKAGYDSSSKADILAPACDSEKALLLKLTEFQSEIEKAYKESAPHLVCQFIYEVSNLFNGFYHDTNILNETDSDLKNSRLALLSFTEKILSKCLDILAIKCPERM